MSYVELISTIKLKTSHKIGLNCISAFTIFLKKRQFTIILIILIIANFPATSKFTLNDVPLREWIYH